MKTITIKLKGGASASEQIERLGEFLDLNESADRVEHTIPFLATGNTCSLLPVGADKNGRLWREDANGLTLVFDPAWIRGAGK